MSGLPIFPVTTATTAQANTFVVQSGMSVEIVVQLKVQVTIPAPTDAIGKRTVPTYSEGTKEYFKTSSSATVPQWRRVARLARIRVEDAEIFELCSQLNSIMSFVSQLKEVNVEGVEPMTSVTPMAMKMREDKVTDGGIPDAILANAPAHEHHFFLVPKVVE